MTREEVRMMLPILKAFSDGEPIQVRCDNGWQDEDSVVLARHPSNYRIKPKARDYWLVNHMDDTSKARLVYDTRNEAESVGNKFGFQIIHVREVI